MKVIKNISGQPLTIDYNFWSYDFPKDREHMVENELYAYLQETLPLAFEFGQPKVAVRGLTKVGRRKTPARIKPVEIDKDMGNGDLRFPINKQPTFGQQGQPGDLLDDGISIVDGVGLEGPGLEVDTI